MPINNITQTISTIPEAGRRGIDVQTVFVNKQEDFQDHLQGTTVTELNALKTQMNTMAGEMNTTASQVNTNADISSTKASQASTSATNASASATTATTKAGITTTKANEASASALKASKWSDEAYNVEVESGRYSAKHWATVAENALDSKQATLVSGTNIKTINGDSVLGSGDLVVTVSTITMDENLGLELEALI